MACASLFWLGHDDDETSNDADCGACDADEIVYVCYAIGIVQVIVKPKMTNAMNTASMTW